MNTQAPSPSDNKVILMSIILYFVIFFFIAHTLIQAQPLKRNDFHEPMLKHIENDHTRILLDKSNKLQPHHYLNEQKGSSKSSNSNADFKKIVQSVAISLSSDANRYRHLRRESYADLSPLFVGGVKF
jgi:hypothetical protein